MSPDVTALDIAIRLGLAALAGILLGLDRGEQGQPAGIRTVMLVCLAATVAMVAGNLLLQTNGKSGESFATIDPMRLPLGILSGIGFIGAGAILKRGEMVEGLTTATTLWMATVIGIAFGAGLLGLGIASTVLGLVILTLVRLLLARFPEHRRGVLIVLTAGPTPSPQDLISLDFGAKLRMRSWSIAADGQPRIEFHAIWRDTKGTHVPPFLADVRSRKEILKVIWEG